MNFSVDNSKNRNINLSEEKSKKEQIYEFLKQEIISNHLKPGTVLVERQICATKNISRTPVREAIQQLVAEGLVTNLNNKGSIVSNITYENIACVYDVREYMEGLAARLCAQRISDSGTKELRGYFLKMEGFLKEKNKAGLSDTDGNFHGCIIKNSRNDVLISIWSNLQNQVQRITRLLEKDTDAYENAHILHRELLEAIERRDPNSAEYFMREHIRNSKVYQLKLFAPNIMDSTL